MLTGLSDSELVRLITEQRNHDALETLFNTYYSHVKKHLTKQFKCSDADADDGAQHAFLALWHGTSLKGDSVFPWLCKCAANFTIQRYRESTRHKLVSLTPVDDEKPLDLPEVRASAEPDFSQAMTGAMDALPVALARLGETYRIALNLRYAQELSLPEIAARIGRTESTASRQIAKGMKLLRQMLGVRPPKKTNYLIHTPAVQASLSHRKKSQERAYAACVSVDKAIGAVGESLRKPVASVGLDGKQRQGV